MDRRAGVHDERDGGTAVDLHRDDRLPGREVERDVVRRLGSADRAGGPEVKLQPGHGGLPQANRGQEMWPARAAYSARHDVSRSRTDVTSITVTLSTPVGRCPVPLTGEPPEIATRPALIPLSSSDERFTRPTTSTSC